MGPQEAEFTFAGTSMKVQQRLAEKPENNKKNQSVTKLALFMSAGTLLSRILGFARDAAVLALFSRTATDVFSAAFALPNFFRRLLGEGSLSVAFIPVYVERLTEDEASGEERSKALANAVFTLVSLASLSIFTALFVGMEPLLRLWLGQESFMSVPGKFELAVSLSRVTIFYLVLVSAYAYFMAIAQAVNRFFVPAVAPALFNLFFVLTILLPNTLFSIPEHKLAWAVIVGGVAQVALVAWLLYCLGKLPRPTLQLRIPGVRMVLLNMAPGILGLAASQLMNIMNQRFAAGLSEGAMTYVYASNRLLELPQSLIAISIGTALLPTLSRFEAKGQTDEFVATTQKQIQLFWFLGLPSAIGLHFLAQPIVQVLFERGRWTTEDSLIVAELIKIIALQLLFSGTSRMLIPGFYARKNTAVPAILTTVIVGFHILLAPVLMASQGVQGLIWSVTISGAFGLLVTSLTYQVMVHKLSWLQVLRRCQRFFPGALAVSLICYFGYPLLIGTLASVLPMGFFSQLIGLFAIIAVSGVSYFAIGHWLQVEESTMVTEKLLKRFKSSR